MPARDRHSAPSGQLGRRLYAIEHSYGVELRTGRLFEDVMGAGDLGARVEFLATAQEGPVSRAQLRAIGMERGQIALALRQRRFVIRHCGVYLVGHTVVTQRGEGIAALLACRRGDALSARSSAALWDFRKDSFERPDVTGVKGDPRTTLEFHRVRSLDQRDVRVHLGLPITSPARTLLDLAELLPVGEVGKALREARVMGLANPAELHSLMARSPGRRGTKVLKRLLDGPEGEPTRSWAEQEMAKLLSRTDLPRPIRNRKLAGKERDMFWPRHKLIVEIDAWSTHEDGPTRTSDRRRDNSSAIAGWETCRFMRTDVRDEPLRVLTTIAHRLGAREP